MTEKKIILVRKITGGSAPIAPGGPTPPTETKGGLWGASPPRGYGGAEPPQIDLRSYVTSFSEPGVGCDLKGKDLIIHVLQQLVAHTEAEVKKMTGDDKKRNQFRITQFKKAVSSLQAHTGQIRSKSDAMKLDNIGKGIGERIAEILATGTLTELARTKEVSAADRLINELSTVTGIGEAHARKFIEQGVTGLDDLRAKAQSGAIKLTHHMEVGLRYYDDIARKIPYAEVADLKATLYQVVQATDSKLMVQVCGSHRRGKAFSGDIDVLITNPEIKSEEDLIRAKVPYLKTVVAALTKAGFLVADLTSHGDTKYMGVCIHPAYKVGHRIDIRFVAYDSYYPALLYFTGSMMTNKLMRTIALDKGYTLNEYGLYRYASGVKGEKITVGSEQEIFQILGIHYLEPTEREIN